MEKVESRTHFKKRKDKLTWRLRKNKMKTNRQLMLLFSLFLVFFMKNITGYSQGKIFIARQSGMEFTMDIEYYNSITGVCTFTQGDQYKVTIYFKNDSGKKIKSDLTYSPQVIINAPDGECGDYKWNVEFNFDLPINPGDIVKRTDYYVIKSGKQPSTIVVSEWAMRGYKFVADN